MPSHSSGTPPEVPEQFRDAYQRAYEQALGTEPDPQTSPETPPGTLPETSPEPHAVAARHESATEYRTRRPAWFFPAAVVAGALVLIGIAYVLGRMVSGGEEAAPPAEKSSAVAESTSPEPDTSPTPLDSPSPETHQGRVAPVAATGAQAGCTAMPGVDSSGNPVRYGAGNMIDDETDTAWRCEGEATGQRLVFDLPAGTELAEVGLIPGYAKTDATSGDDRYAENNRITKVAWILADGSEIEQELSAEPRDRSMRTLRVPVTAGDQVTLQIDAVEKGKRNTTMISEVWFAAAG